MNLERLGTFAAAVLGSGAALAAAAVLREYINRREVDAYHDGWRAGMADAEARDAREAEVSS